MGLYTVLLPTLGTPIKYGLFFLHIFDRCVCVCVCVSQQHKSGLGRLIVEVSRSHTIGHTHKLSHTQAHPVQLLWKCDQLVPEVATYATRKAQRKTTMPSVGFQSTITAIERQQVYTSDARQTGSIVDRVCTIFILFLFSTLVLYGVLFC